MTKPTGLPRGRPKGRKNLTTRERKRREAKLAAAGLTPLEHFLNILRNVDLPMARRDWAATQAAPYMHSKLASTESKITGTLTLADLVIASMKKPPKDDDGGGSGSKA